MRAFVIVSLFAAAAGGCRSSKPAASVPGGYPTIGHVERLDPALDAIIAPDAKIEKLAEGFRWSEGPVWTGEGGGALLFSDVPKNVVYKWQPGGVNVSEYLKPSGYTGAVPRAGEPGSNGLLLDRAGSLVLCQHGDRRVARREANGAFSTLVDRFDGKRLNSPNDAVYRSTGDLYFTDPPYGLEKQNDDPAKEIPWSGVYRVTPDGAVSLLTKELTFPNGIAFSPDEKTLYVANSDPQRAIWMAYDVAPDGNVGAGRVFFDATAAAKAGRPGLPDGLKVDDKGNLFATGPGGVLVFSPEGKHLGTIVTGEPTANCAWGEDGTVLYMTANDKLTRIKLLTRAGHHPFQ